MKNRIMIAHNEFVWSKEADEEQGRPELAKEQGSQQSTTTKPKEPARGRSTQKSRRTDEGDDPGKDHPDGGSPPKGDEPQEKKRKEDEKEAEGEGFYDAQSQHSDGDEPKGKSSQQGGGFMGGGAVSVERTPLEKERHEAVERVKRLEEQLNRERQQRKDEETAHQAAEAKAKGDELVQEIEDDKAKADKKREARREKKRRKKQRKDGQEGPPSEEEEEESDEKEGKDGEGSKPEGEESKPKIGPRLICLFPQFYSLLGYFLNHKQCRGTKMFLQVVGVSKTGYHKKVFLFLSFESWRKKRDEKHGKGNVQKMRMGENPKCFKSAILGRGLERFFFAIWDAQKVCSAENTIFIVFSAKHSFAEIKECNLKNRKLQQKENGVCLPTCKKVLF